MFSMPFVEALRAARDEYPRGATLSRVQLTRRTRGSQSSRILVKNGPSGSTSTGNAASWWMLVPMITITGMLAGRSGARTGMLAWPRGFSQAA